MPEAVEVATPGAIPGADSEEAETLAILSRKPVTQTPVEAEAVGPKQTFPEV